LFGSSENTEPVTTNENNEDNGGKKEEKIESAEAQPIIVSGVNRADEDPSLHKGLIEIVELLPLVVTETQSIEPPKESPKEESLEELIEKIRKEKEFKE